MSERPFRIYCDGAVLSERPGVILARRARSCALKAAPVAWCGEKVHFPGAKNYTFRWKRVILPIACCSEKDFKKCTFRRKRVTLLAAACLLVAKCGF